MLLEDFPNNQGIWEIYQKIYDKSIVKGKL